MRRYTVFLILFLTVSILTVLAQEKPHNPKGSEKTISLDYKDADLANVLRSLSWTYKLNIVTSSDIKGKVTINLQDVAIKEALEAILTINGLTYSERKGIIYISPGDPEAVEMRNEVIFLKYLSAPEAQNLLRKIISSKGDMKINEVTNGLIITDFAENIKKIKILLKKIDIAPQQVLIEAKIVDITSTDLRALGTTWDLNYNPSHGIFGRNTATSEQLQGTISMAEQSGDLTGGQLVLNTFSIKGVTITATVDALVRDGRANLLASPSIAVLNGHEARIVIGERYPYKERTQTTTGTTETTRFVDIGTTLRVTPQINDDGYITMRIHPEVSSLADALDAGPRITTREADTTVRIKEGETLVIGGLIKQQDNRSSDRIPLLGRIPILGFLFSRSERDLEQKELAVFITPKILRSEEEKELLSKKKIEKEEAYVTLEKTANLTLVERVFQDALNLDKGTGLLSVRKTQQFRKAQALSLYEYILSQFSDSERAPETMYRAGLIYYNHLSDYEKAKELFARLISDYPKSSFVKKATLKHNSVEFAIAEEKKGERRKQIEKEAAEKSKATRNIDKVKLTETIEQQRKKQEKAAQERKEQKKKGQELKVQEQKEIQAKIQAKNRVQARAKAIYRNGLSYYRKVKAYSKAKEVLAGLMLDYPDSIFAKKAARLINKIALTEMKEQEKEEQEKRMRQIKRQQRIEQEKIAQEKRKQQRIERYRKEQIKIKEAKANTMYQTGLTYYKQLIYKKARLTLSGLIIRYPDSTFAEKAIRLIDKIKLTEIREREKKEQEKTARLIKQQQQITRQKKEQAKRGQQRRARKKRAQAKVKEAKAKAMYQTGLSYYQQSNYRRGRQTLSRLISGYPGSNFAKKAAQLMVKIEVMEGKENGVKKNEEIRAETLYEIALGYIDNLSDYEEAGKIFLTIIADYPGSSFAKQAKDQYDKIEKSLKNP